MRKIIFFAFIAIVSFAASPSVFGITWSILNKPLLVQPQPRTSTTQFTTTPPTTDLGVMRPNLTTTFLQKFTPSEKKNSTAVTNTGLQYLILGLCQIAPEKCPTNALDIQTALNELDIQMTVDPDDFFPPPTLADYFGFGRGGGGGGAPRRPPGVGEDECWVCERCNCVEITSCCGKDDNGQCVMWCTTERCSFCCERC